MPMNKKLRRNCLYCGIETSRPSYIYCSNQCQADLRYSEYISRWQSGEESGLQGIGIVSRHVKRYLREKYNNQCCICGWAEVNIVTMQVPLVADHIDGDWRNNLEINLRLICPNCDSLTATYAGLNRGKGRSGRVLSKRAIDGRLFKAKPE